MGNWRDGLRRCCRLRRSAQTSKVYNRYTPRAIWNITAAGVCPQFLRVAPNAPEVNLRARNDALSRGAFQLARQKPGSPGVVL